MAQLSKSLAHRSICADVTRAGSATNAVSMRASYQPVSQRAVASWWSGPIRLASTRMSATVTPNAWSEGMAYRAMPSRVRLVP